MIVSDWVESAREYLGTGVVEQVNRLSAAYNPGDTSLSLQYELAGIKTGLPISVGLNCFMIWAASPSVKEVEVSAGWAGAPDNIAQSGEIVRVRPTYYTHRIFNAINETLTELSSPLMGVYGVDTHSLEFLSTQTAYDLTGAEEIDNVLRVQYGDPYDPNDTWPELGFREWDFRSIAPNTQFPSGKQLLIYGQIPADSTVRVTFSRRLVKVDTLQDDVSLTFLPDTAWDLPAIGAASRLAMPGEFRRNRMDSQGDTRRADEVPAGAVLGGARALRAMYQARVEQEASRLMSVYPPKQR